MAAAILNKTELGRLFCKKRKINLAAIAIITNIAAENSRYSGIADFRHKKQGMKKSMTFFSVALAAKLLVVTIMLTGCVSKKQFVSLQSDYTALQKEYGSLQDKYQASQIDLAASQTQVKSLEDRLADAQKANAELKAQYNTLSNSLNTSLSQNTQSSVNISKLVDEINASNAYIKHLVEVKSKSDSLNLALTNKLTRSLSRDELSEVDIKVLKGVVYISLADNMLYKSGSYEINERAGQTLSKIAKIITDYKEYEVLIEGNTDNVPINRTNIRNNWDLSALRASSVVQALQTQYGVDPKRLSAAGRGEYNPIATNNTEVGRQRNRRTQIIITPKLDQFMELIDEAPETKDK